MSRRAQRLCVSIVTPLLGLLLTTLAYAQPESPILLPSEPTYVGEGWAGFLNFRFLLDTLLTLILATVLGATLAYHPRLLETADTLEEIDAGKVYMLYSVIGALTGILVVHYGLVVGFVLFGIGGLIRFRTLLHSAVLTGHVIFITLVGLTCGLNMPHVGVLATAFAFGLIYVIDAKITYQAEIRDLPLERFAEATAAYNAALVQAGCKVISQSRNRRKRRLSLVFQRRRYTSAHELEVEIERSVEPLLQGSVDWKIH